MNSGQSQIYAGGRVLHSSLLIRALWGAGAAEVLGDRPQILDSDYECLKCNSATISSVSLSKSSNLSGPQFCKSPGKERRHRWRYFAGLLSGLDKMKLRYLVDTDK